jgi:3-hydroxyacyl-[acyl-carrier-protein] dehydratase
MVTPGETLQLEIVMQKLGSRMGSAVGTASVNGEKACSATITFVIPPESALPNPSGSTAS